ncbi:MAG: LamG-like jellyroll fold domain-containing protein, partial [Solirubrobacterales bacterium]
GGSGGDDEWVATRATVSSPWGAPVNLGPTINSSGYDGCPSISDDGLMLTFNSDRPGGYGNWDVWVATRATTNDPWGAPVNAGPAVNSPAREHCTDICSNGLLLFFVSERAGGFGRTDLWMTRRPTTKDPWGPPVHFESPVNYAGLDHGPIASNDGTTFYFSSDRPGGSGGLDLWQMSITPVVDFNGDGKVDTKDLLRLIESWRKYDPSVDMGPTPLGDGVVDEKDLEVLMSHWGEEPGLIAKWKLDEVSGTTAADSTGANDGTLKNEPRWQPDGGIEGGAILLDGVDDYIETPFVLDPAAGPFSVFAWIKSGLPGQTILSQAGGVNWLMLTPSGALATDLRQSGRSNKPLVSTALVADDVWHQVGVVWDGSNRILYVDGVEIARDKQANLAGSAGGLHLGAGAALELGAFWSGPIDNVRIYNRPVEP